MCCCSFIHIVYYISIILLIYGIFTEYHQWGTHWDLLGFNIKTLLVTLNIKNIVSKLWFPVTWILWGCWGIYLIANFKPWSLPLYISTFNAIVWGFLLPIGMFLWNKLWVVTVN